MTYSQLMYLDLRQPLNYPQIEALPESISENDEFLLCYELNPAQANSIEPEKELFLGKKDDKTTLTLATGRYVFVQNRRETPLNQEEWLDMAIEQQKDGLWERNKLGNQLYVRYLYEDGLFVTQLFRAIT